MPLARRFLAKCKRVTALEDAQMRNVHALEAVLAAMKEEPARRDDPLGASEHCRGCTGYDGQYDKFVPKR